MQISEVRIKLMDDPHERLQAFCSVTFDGCFVIRDLKIIQGAKGSFVAMPSRKLTDRCPRCHTKNHLRAQYCNHCGAKLDEERAAKDDDGRAKLYADIAHPINSECRDMIQQVVLKSYDEEIVRASQPDYICTYDDYGEDNYARLCEDEEQAELPVVVKRAESTHRMESGSGRTGGPHHHLSARAQNGVPQHAAANDERADAPSGEEESFGAGLL